MSKVALSGNALGSGTLTIAAPNTSTDRTINLPDAAGTVAVTGGQPSFVSTIGVGNATPSSSGAGITFPATQSASTDANTLDDYEEGTFTPSISAGSGSITSYTSSGHYVKVGRLVTIVAGYTITNNGTGAAYGIIGNFPFIVRSLSAIGVDRIAGTTGNTCTGPTSLNGNACSLFTYNNLYPWSTNAQGYYTLSYFTD